MNLLKRIMNVVSILAGIMTIAGFFNESFGRAIMGGPIFFGPVLLINYILFRKPTIWHESA